MTTERTSARRIPKPIRDAATKTRNAALIAWRVLQPVLARVVAVLRPLVRVVTGAGWIVLGFAVLSLVLSAAFGWQEFTYLGMVLLACLLLAALFLFGRASYGVFIELNPRRVVVGERAMGRMVVTNAGTRSVPASRMELPVGRGVAEFALPTMAPGAEHEELFAVPTNRRAVIVAGPAETVRGDQLGLLRRSVRWAEPVDLFVHPRTVRLAPSAAGLVRDLEGQVSNRITNNDLAFHALRPYVPGDDRRYVHWRTSARIGQLMVRQFNETRRSQVTIVHPTRSDLYSSEEEFELAISITASLAAQVIREGTQISVVSESGAWRTRSVVSMLDSSARLEPTGRQYASVREFARVQTHRLAEPSVVITVGGSGMTTTDFRSVQTLFGQEVAQIAVHAEAGGQPRYAAVAGMTVLTAGRLDDLPSLVNGLTR